MEPPMYKTLRASLLLTSAIVAVSGCKKTDQITVTADGIWTLNGNVLGTNELHRYLEYPPSRDVSVSGGDFTFEGTAKEFSDAVFNGISTIVLESIAQSDGPEDKSNPGKEDEIEKIDPFSPLEPKANAEQTEALKP